MITLEEGKLEFIFQHSNSTKYDDWAFYRNQLTNAFGKSKAVDAHPRVVDQRSITPDMPWTAKSLPVAKLNPESVN